MEAKKAFYHSNARQVPLAEFPQLLKKFVLYHFDLLKENQNEFLGLLLCLFDLSFISQSEVVTLFKATNK